MTSVTLSFQYDPGPQPACGYVRLGFGRQLAYTRRGAQTNEKLSPR